MGFFLCVVQLNITVEPYKAYSSLVVVWYIRSICTRIFFTRHSWLFGRYDRHVLVYSLLVTRGCLVDTIDMYSYILYSSIVVVW